MVTDRRPCRGANSNVCVAEGCYGEACVALPRVTVVVVCTPADEVDNGAMMHAVHSVEQQDYPRELVDVHIVRNLYGQPLAQMQRLGVKTADTEWVAFIDVAQVWDPGMLRLLVSRALEHEGQIAFGGTGLVGGRGYGTIVRRDAYLRLAVAG